jgi:hypothetical protein
VQIIDVHIPTTDGRELVLERYTEPERDFKLPLGSGSFSRATASENDRLCPGQLLGAQVAKLEFPDRRTLAWGHDPDVLNGPTFKHPGTVPLATLLTT